MALLDDDIVHMFTLIDGQVCWSQISMTGLPALYRSVAEKHNRKAGTPVAFWNGSNDKMMINAAGVPVTEARIVGVLQRPAPEARQVTPKAAAKSAVERSADRKRARDDAAREKSQAAGDLKRAAGWTRDARGVWHEPTPESVAAAPAAPAAVAVPVSVQKPYIAPWADPLDPNPGDGDDVALFAWLKREGGRRDAFKAAQAAGR